LASQPTPTTTPAARSDRPLERAIARIINHSSAVVLNRSKVVVVTKWPTASAKPDEAVQAAAITCARREPPTSRAISVARSVVAAAASAEGSRRRSSEPGASSCIAQLTSGTSGGWSGYPNAGCDPATMKYNSSG
jgi:hypothetical protein